MLYDPTVNFFFFFGDLFVRISSMDLLRIGMGRRDTMEERVRVLFKCFHITFTNVFQVYFEIKLL